MHIEDPTYDHDPELAIQKNFMKTSVHFAFQLSAYELTGNPKDQRVLDLCAGMSDFTAYLLDHSVDAYAVDMDYADIDSMISKRHQEIHDEVSQRFPRPELDKQAFVDQANKFYLPFERFKHSLHSYPSRYVAARATSLPYDDSTFDHVLSFSGVSSDISCNMEVLRDVTQEAIRVTKPGGTVQYAPIFSVAESLENLDVLTTELNENASVRSASVIFKNQEELNSLFKIELAE